MDRDRPYRRSLSQLDCFCFATEESVASPFPFVDFLAVLLFFAIWVSVGWGGVIGALLFSVSRFLISDCALPPPRWE